MGRLNGNSSALSSFALACDLTDLELFDEKKRRHDMARLDAIYLALYGITSTDDIDEIFSNFGRLAKSEIKNPEIGFFATRELIKAYLRLFIAGDFTSKVNESGLAKLYMSN